MAAQGVYINPINPKGYYSCKVFGSFPPRNSIRARCYASHKKISTEGSLEVDSLLLTSGKRGRSRRLAKSLPPIHVTKIREHIFACKEETDRSQRQLSNRDTNELPNLNPRLQAEEGNDTGKHRWWGNPTTPYKVRPTNFENKNSCLKDSSTEMRMIQPMENEGNTQTDKLSWNSAHFSSVIHYPAWLELPPTPIASPSSSYLATSTHYKRYLNPMDAKAVTSTEWWYSRSRSGLRRPIGKLSQAYVLDLVHSDTCKEQTKVNTDASSKVAGENVSNTHASSSATHTDQQTLAHLPHTAHKKPAIIKNNIPFPRLKIPKITIEGDSLQKRTPSHSKKRESEFSKKLKLLELTCEWMKVLQTFNENIQENHSAESPTLTVVNLNDSLLLPSLPQECPEATCSDYQPPKEANSPVTPVIPAQVLSFPGDSFESKCAQKPVTRVPPSCIQSLRNKPSETLEKTASNPYPDMVIFGQQVKSLLKSGIELSEEDMEILSRVTGSVTSGVIRPEDIDFVKSIVRGALDVSQLQMISEGQLLIDLLDKYRDSEDRESLISFESLLARSRYSLQGTSSGQTFSNNQLLVSDTGNAHGEQAISSEQGWHISNSHTNQSGNDKNIISSFGQSKKPKLDRKTQAKYSKLENEIVESAREDLKYLEESMSMKPDFEDGETESLIDPFTKRRVNKQGRTSETFSDRINNMSSLTKLKRAKILSTKRENQLTSQTDEEFSSDSQSQLTSQTDGHRMKISDESGNRVARQVGRSLQRKFSSQSETDGSQLEFFTDEETTDSPYKKFSKKKANRGTKQTADTSNASRQTSSKYNSSRQNSSRYPSSRYPSSRYPSSTYTSSEDSSQSSKSSRVLQAKSLSRNATVANFTMGFPGSNHPAASQASAAIIANLTSTKQAQFAVDYFNELNDVRAFANEFLKTVNPPEMTISSSRPSTGEGRDPTDQEARLLSRERATRANSLLRAKLMALAEKDRLVKPPKLTEEELEIERMRVALERKKRAERLQDELEQSLDTEDSIRQRRAKREESEQERVRLLKAAKAQRERRLEQERLKHAAVLDKLRMEGEVRQNEQLYVGVILDEHNDMLQVWDDIDYEYISHYLGSKYSENIRAKEKERIQREKVKLEAMIQEALDFQRTELMKKLQDAQKKFSACMHDEVEKVEQLLRVSRAFIYSYYRTSYEE